MPFTRLAAAFYRFRRTGAKARVPRGIIENTYYSGRGARERRGRGERPRERKTNFFHSFLATKADRGFPSGAKTRRRRAKRRKDRMTLFLRSECVCYVENV